MDNELTRKIQQLEEKTKKLENYLKVFHFEDYQRVNDYMGKLNYLSLDYIKKNTDLKEQLIFYYRMMIRARIKNDFLEYCRFAVMQIELITGHFLEELEKRGEIKIQRGDYNRIERINGEKAPYLIDKVVFFLQFLQCQNREKLKEVFDNTIKLRNIISHADSAYLNIQERIKSK